MHVACLLKGQREVKVEDVMDNESESDLSSTGDIGEDIRKLDHKVELLTEANADLENERDSLLNDKVCILQLKF